MPLTIFFSWQIDTETPGGRNLIERALERACSRISADTSIEEAVRENITVDRDTKGVAGSPPIVDTIFRKIDGAAVFVPDLTFIGKRPDGRPTPNPNVLVEYGWALKSLGHTRIVPVINTAYGEPFGDSMPFDMRHLRNPITYDCAATLDDAERRRGRETLAKELEGAIRLVLESDEYKASLPTQPKPRSFVAREPIDGRGRFKAVAEPVGMLVDGGLRGDVRELFVSGHPVCWFRLMPVNDPGRTWTIDELRQAMQKPFLEPLNSGWSGYDFVRSHDGFGIYSSSGENRDQTRAIVFAFTTGEVWSIDTYSLEGYRDDNGRFTIPTNEACFRNALQHYARFLERLGIKAPFKWIAGMENLKGRYLYIPLRPGYMRIRSGPDGKCLEDVITISGEYSGGDAPGPTLKPFFERLYNACGVSRQAWQDV